MPIFLQVIVRYVKCKLPRLEYELRSPYLQIHIEISINISQSISQDILSLLLSHFFLISICLPLFSFLYLLPPLLLSLTPSPILPFAFTFHLFPSPFLQLFLFSLHLFAYPFSLSLSLYLSLFLSPFLSLYLSLFLSPFL